MDTVIACGPPPPGVPFSYLGDKQTPLPPKLKEGPQRAVYPLFVLLTTLLWWLSSLTLF